MTQIEEVQIANTHPDFLNTEGKRGLACIILKNKKTKEELEILDDNDLLDEVDKMPEDKIDEILKEGGYECE